MIHTHNRHHQILDRAYHDLHNDAKVAQALLTLQSRPHHCILSLHRLPHLVLHRSHRHTSHLLGIRQSRNHDNAHHRTRHHTPHRISQIDRPPLTLRSHLNHLLTLNGRWER